MSDLIRKRLTGKEEGFTLIELLVVIVILGILMAIAIPSYMGFKDRANKTAAMANVRSTIPSAEAYYQDNGNSGYTDLTADMIRAGGTLTNGDAEAAIDPNLSADVLVVPNSDGTGYCISDEVGGFIAAITNPGGTIEASNDGTTVVACA